MLKTTLSEASANAFLAPINGRVFTFKNTSVNMLIDMITSSPITISVIEGDAKLSLNSDLSNLTSSVNIPTTRTAIYIQAGGYFHLSISNVNNISLFYFQPATTTSAVLPVDIQISDLNYFLNANNIIFKNVAISGSIDDIEYGFFEKIASLNINSTNVTGDISALAKKIWEREGERLDYPTLKIVGNTNTNGNNINNIPIGTSVATTFTFNSTGFTAVNASNVPLINLTYTYNALNGSWDVTTNS